MGVLILIPTQGAAATTPRPMVPPRPCLMWGGPRVGIFYSVSFLILAVKGCSVVTTSAAWVTSVRPGKGTCIAETSHKHVHQGAREHATPKRSVVCVGIGTVVFAVVLMGVLLVILVPGTATTAPQPMCPQALA